MVNVLEFNNYDMTDPDTYPSQEGKYLLRYFHTDPKENHLPNYEILWWKKDFKGFYFDQNCVKENNVEKAFNYRVFGWAFLPNMCNSFGNY